MKTLYKRSSHRLRAVPLQSVESKLGRTGQSEKAERESFPMASFFLLSPASLDFLARVTILRDSSQSKARTREKNSLTREKKTA